MDETREKESQFLRTYVGRRLVRRARLRVKIPSAGYERGCLHEQHVIRERFRTGSLRGSLRIYDYDKDLLFQYAQI